MLFLTIWIYLLFSCVSGNTEKVIFLGPPSVDLASAYPSLDYPRLKALDPNNNSIRMYLEVESSINAFRGGKPSWLVLRNLTESQRYEVRVCWAATVSCDFYALVYSIRIRRLIIILFQQPTMFKFEVYELKTIFSTPELLSELSEHASSLHQDVHDDAVSSHALQLDGKQSILLLRILTVADFYTKNHTLMGDAPPVLVDIIMDPFVLNVLPWSLLPTVAYIGAVAVVSWFIGNWTSSLICQTITEPRSEKKNQ